jgi:type III secretion apparatus needle protein
LLHPKEAVMAGLSIGALVGGLGSAVSAAEADLQAAVNSGDMSSPAGLFSAQVAMTEYQTAVGLQSSLVSAFKQVREGILQKM